MTVQITIRNVPVKVRDVLAARAASEHRSMQEFLLCELERIASRPTLEAWLQTLSERRSAARSSVPASKILHARDADRR